MYNTEVYIRINWRGKGNGHLAERVLERVPTPVGDDGGSSERCEFGVRSGQMMSSAFFDPI